MGERGTKNDKLETVGNMLPQIWSKLRRQKVETSLHRKSWRPISAIGKNEKAKNWPSKDVLIHSSIGRLSHTVI